MADTKEYLSGGRIQGSSTKVQTAPNTSWKEIGRYTVAGSSTGTITVRGLDSATSGTMTLKDNLMLVGRLDLASLSDIKMTFNGDSSGSNANYAQRRSPNFNASTGGNSITSADYIEIGDAMVDRNYFRATIKNDDHEKYVIHHVLEEAGTAEDVQPDTEDSVGKWANTAQIHTITFTSSSGNFEIGSEIVVLGCDDDEADSGTNAWQQTGVVLTSENLNTITCSFTTKKYLMVEAYIPNVGSEYNHLRMQFNGDTNARYVNRYSENGGSSGAASANYLTVNAGASRDSYMVFYIFAVDSEPKMVMCRTAVENGRFNMYGKWYKQGGEEALTSLRIYNSDGTNSAPLLSGSEIRVWGFD
jgi:hypothetical protein